MLRVLRECNFGPAFIRWIEVFNTKTQSSVSNNGLLSGWFDIERGIRQSCSLTGLLFILDVKVLANKIWQNEDVKGKELPDGNVLRISQYADDLSLFVQDESSIHNVVSIICAWIKFEYSAILWYVNRTQS